MMAEMTERCSTPKKEWAPSVDAYNAIMWQCLKEEKFDEVHSVMDRIRVLKMAPNNRTAQILQRAGEKMRQIKRCGFEERYSWETARNTATLPSPRLRVGL